MMRRWQLWWGDKWLRRFPRLAALSREQRWRTWGACYEAIRAEPVVRAMSIAVLVATLLGAMAGSRVGWSPSGIPLGGILGAVVGAVVGAAVRGVVVRDRAGAHIDRILDGDGGA
ncbi:MAG: hypothetical protein ACK595_10040 [Planctomycetota bacterium]